jgi:hypothetical protein
MAIKKSVWKETAEVLGVVGIIAGIVFLGYELRQNNELMAAEARFNYLVLVTNAYSDLAFNRDYAELRIKSANGETLDATDYLQLEAAVMRVLTTFQWTYLELPVDSPEQISLRDTAQRLFDEAIFRRVWNDRKSGFDEPFVHWLEQEISQPE